MKLGILENRIKAVFYKIVLQKIWIKRRSAYSFKYGNFNFL